MAAEKERDPGSSSAEIEKYLDILAKDPNSRVFAPLAEAYRKAGFLDDAVETALEGLRVHPNYLGGRVALGRAYFEKRQYVDAAVEMQKVAKSAPDNIIAHKVLGQIASRQNDLPAAEKAFKMVLLLDPRDEEAQQFLADLAGRPAAAPAPPTPVPTPTATPAPVPVPDRPELITLEPVPPQQPLPQQVSPPPTAPLPFDEIQAIEDIDLQADDIFSEPAPPPASSVEQEDSPFEVFTRDRSKATPAPVKVERIDDAGPRELDIETTAYNPPDEFIADGVAAPMPVPDDESSRIDLTREIDFSSPDDTPPLPLVPASEPEPEAFELELGTEPELESGLESEAELKPEPDPVSAIEFEPGFEPEFETELELEPETESETESESEPEPEPEPDFELGAEREPEPEPGPGADLELDLEADLEAGEFPPPSIDPAPVLRFEPPEEVYEDISPEEEEPAAAEVGRGVFDTETLASIYTSQGFYGRAAGIYTRLITQNPADPGLRGKLEEVLALERRESGVEERVAAVGTAPLLSPVPTSPAPPPAPAQPEQTGVSARAQPTGSDRTISQLNSLLEAFKEGRPR